MCDLPDVYSMAERIARKQHKCCECHGAIMPGEKYHHHAGIWGGVPASYKVCLDCDELRVRVVKDCELYPEETPAFGHLGNDCEDDHLKDFRAIQAKRGAVATAVSA